MSHHSRKFGRIYTVDARDANYMLSRDKKSLQKRKTWYCTSPLNQGNTPECVGYAWNAWFTASPTRQDPISPSGIYKFAKYEDGLPKHLEGTTIRAGAKVLVASGHISNYKWCWTINVAITHLLTEGPLVVGTNWYEGMDEPFKGYVSLSGNCVGGHAYLLYGVDIERQIFRIHNSWGDLWGREGKAMIRFKDFQRLLDEDGECCAATEIKR